MSVTATVACIALIVSLLPLIVLGQRDPKRLRSRRGAVTAVTPLGPRSRQVLATLVLIPGIVLMAASLWPAFMVWLGALIAFGWILVLLLGREA